MWKISGILVVTAVIAVLEVPTLWKQKLVKELWVFAILLLAGAGLSFALIMHVILPSPLDFLTWMYKPVSDVFKKFLS
ncbi:hypothetical protein [Paenibacillus ginsengarvi]|uniref:Stage III sporulation protein AF n=1 Tax=Paenibacillus ginsengarvi TaxID=400777 RepID=A0A3B0CBV1_9BACL|nr:hypothetical protein [Paenibacillus ginsengarvi]RKN82068.1 hypothetical protein D7M11_17025 [Paenibacillus ginsengarvi]